MKKLIIILLFAVCVNAQPVFKKAFLQNSGIGFHVLGGEVITLGLHKCGVSKTNSFLITIGFAVLWEVIEYNIDPVKKIYGSKKNFYIDAFGDVAGAGIASITLVVFL